MKVNQNKKNTFKNNFYYTRDQVYNAYSLSLSKKKDKILITYIKINYLIQTVSSINSALITNSNPLMAL